MLAVYKAKKFPWFQKFAMGLCQSWVRSVIAQGEAQSVHQNKEQNIWPD